jgi:uncharacterized phage protein gp47/JayE
MVVEPTPRDDIEDSIESRLRGRITKLTNFVSSSFNKLFLGTFAEELYEFEVRLLAAQLSGWVDYAGGPITESDLEQLGLDNFDDLDLLNEYMLDEHLDNLGALVGTERDNGEKATADVRIDVFDQNTRVPDGMRVATPPDFDGDQFIYEVDLGNGTDFVTPSDQGNADYVDVSVIADEEGSEYNVGSGRIIRLRSPPPGVEGVNNPTAATGGEDEETNDELRERIKNAVFETSGGGTTAGIEGFIIGNVDGVNDVFVDEFINATPVYVDVVVDGGVESEVEDAIDTSRPAGIRHNLVRPVTYNIAVEVELQGTDIDQLQIKDEIENYVFELDLGEDYIGDVVTQRILNVEEDVENILAVNVRLTEVINDRITFQSGTDIYSLADDELGFIEDEQHYYSSDKDVYSLGIDPVDDSTVSVEAVVNDSPDTILTGGGTDYTVVDSNGDGMLDAIDFSGGSTTPDDGTVFEVNYETVTSTSETFTYDGSQDYELTYLPALADDSSVSDNSGDTYTIGTDYDIIDTDSDGEKDTLRWLSGGSTPDNPEDFTVDYEVNVGSIYEVTGTLNSTEGHEFVEGTDFNELDNDSDGHADAIDWSLAGDDPDDGTGFVVDATIQKHIDEDYFVSQREKISPVVDEVEITTYE